MEIPSVFHGQVRYRPPKNDRSMVEAMLYTCHELSWASYTRLTNVATESENSGN